MTDEHPTESGQPAVARAARRRRRGAHVVEFALTLPAFVMILAGTFDFGWLFFQQAMLDNAVHEGCRAGAVVDPASANPEDTAEDKIRELLDNTGQKCPDDSTCEVTMSRTGVRPAISLRCDVERNYSPLFGMVPHPDRIGSRTLVRFEWQDLVD